jgi:hypothetical protein
VEIASQTRRQMQGIVGEQSVSLLQLQGPGEIGRFVGHEKQVASQEIFDLLSIPDKLTNQGRILRESSGWI